jgi:hypothetical protein
VRIRSLQERRAQNMIYEKVFVQRVYPTQVLRKAVSHLNTPMYLTMPTEDQKHFVLVSLTLGFTSIITAFFPVCAFPAAITGLLLGLYGRNTTSLRTMSSWAIVLSVIGLILTCIDTVMLISIYFERYLWQ